MNKISEIGSTFFAYLKRPDLYPELRRKIWKNIFNRSSGLRGKEEAEKWCASLAISEKNFIENILKTTFVPFEKLFPDEFASALQAQAKAPFCAASICSKRRRAAKFYTTGKISRPAACPRRPTARRSAWCFSPLTFFQT